MTKKEPRQPQFWCTDIRIAIAANHHQDYTTEELVTAVEASIRQYAQFTPVRLSIVDTQAASEDPTCSIDDGECPNVWIGFPPDWEKFDSKRAALTLRWFDATRGEIYSSNILFHPDKPFGVIDPENRTVINDLQSTLMHEFGHVFGLGHSDNKDACMWGGDSVLGETKKRSLHIDDENGMKAIYTRDRLEACGYAIPTGYVFAAEATSTETGKGPMIRGSIRDTAGNGISEVKVTLTSVDEPGYRIETISGDDGSFMATGIANSQIRIHATSKGYVSLIYEVPVYEESVEISGFVMQTLDEAFAVLSMQKPAKNLTGDLAADIFNMALDQYSRENWAAAEQLARRAIKMDSSQYEAFRILIWSNYKLGDWQDVLGFGEQFLKTNPTSEKILQLTLYAAGVNGNTDSLEKIMDMMRASGQVSVADIVD